MIFSRTASEKFLLLYKDYEQRVQAGSQAEQQGTDGEMACFMSELPQKHIRTCLSRTFFDAFDIEEKLYKALARHAQSW